MRNLLIVFVIFIGGQSINCGEVSYSINVKNVVNTISEKFISFDVDFMDLIELCNGKNGVKQLKMLNQISPAYLKLSNFSTFVLRNNNEKKVNKTLIVEIMKTLNIYDITPVIVLDYDVEKFEPIHVLHDFKAAKNFNIDKCIWQLGDDSMELKNVASVRKYVDNLKTMKVLCESVRREQNMDWNIAGVAAHKRLRNEHLPFQVFAMNFKRLMPNEIFSRSMSASMKLRHENAWVSVTNSSLYENDSKSESTPGNCNHSCLMNGLHFARILGEMAKKGFGTVFIDESLKESGNTLKLAVTSLHKKLIGSGVFEARNSKALLNGKTSSNLYAYCSKKPSGALTLMGINFSNMRTKFNVRLSATLDPNVSIIQYLLSVQNGQIQLNNEKFTNDSTPNSSIKFKKLSKFSIPLTLPPFSLAFWTLKNVRVEECLKMTTIIDQQQKEIESISSTDILLRSLVANEMKNNQNVKSLRNKRQTDQFLPSTFEFEFPEIPKNLKFPNLMMTSASNTKPIIESLFSKLPSVNNNNNNKDENPFQLSENPLLPRGDVYMFVDNGEKVMDTKNNYEDFVIVTDENEKSKKSQNKKKSKLTTTAPATTTESNDDFDAHDYADLIQKQSRKKVSSLAALLSKKKNQRDDDGTKEIGELFEVEQVQASGASKSEPSTGGSSSSSKSENIELKTVIKELEPTYRQSKKALRKAQKKWEKARITELLKNAQFEEIDREKVKDHENYDIIDLADVDKPNYEEYDDDEDDDGFFSERKIHQQHQQQKRRNKRQVEVLRINNRIPKLDYNNMISDSSEETSIEGDVHMYLQSPPRHNHHDDDDTVSKDDVPTNKQIASTMPSDDCDSTVVKAINFFTNSFNRALNVLDNTIVGCWEIFKPKEYL